ncbi:MAG: SCP2 sterol-binding domain-containing protein [Proteobacteria bacterium]|nr:SCP2 sterol-binding domain-containing protein [Pseudomonadota bacterium]
MVRADNIQQVFEEMPRRFNSAAAAGLTAVYQYELSGDGGGTWHVVIANGVIEGDLAQAGAHPKPNISVTISVADFLDMINGELNPQMAFMGGKLKIKGDMSLAMKMQQIFPTG